MMKRIISRFLMTMAFLAAFSCGVAQTNQQSAAERAKQAAKIQNAKTQTGKTNQATKGSPSEQRQKEGVRNQAAQKRQRLQEENRKNSETESYSSKSTQYLINEYGNLCKEMVQAIKDGDAKKISSLAEKGNKLEKELSKRDLTEEEREQIQELTSEILGSVFGTMDIDIIDTQELRETETTPVAVDDGKVFDAVEQPPTFPGGDKAMFDFIGSKLVFPQEAINDNVGGRVLVRFVVKKDGSVGDVQVLRGKHPALDKEAMRVVKLLPKFTPGKQNGQAVNVWFTLPINFNIQAANSELRAESDSTEGTTNTDELREKETTPVAVDDSKVFEAVEQPPTFPGGDKALYDFISSHLKYPQDALEEGVSGRVLVKFVVKKDGSVGDVQVVRGQHPALDKEAVRLAKSLPKFNPGKQNGQAVNTWFNLPINFNSQRLN